MATLFSELGAIAADQGFQQRVTYALCMAAMNVYTEDSSTAGHPARKAFAVRVLSGSGLTPMTFLLVLTNPSIAAEATFATKPDFAIPDGDIQFTVNSLWNTMSGA